MSDNEDYNSDIYSDSSESDSDSVKVVNKKNVVINAASKFGKYVEDDEDIDDSEIDDIEDENEDDDEVEAEDEQIGGGDDDDELDDSEVKEEDDDVDPDDIVIDEDGEVVEKSDKPTKTPKPTKNSKSIKATQLINAVDDEDDDEYEENYLQKFDNELNKNYIYEFHPECLNHNSDEVSKMARVIRDENNIIIDSLHRTLPYLTKYEKARVLGQRAKQIETGAKPLVRVPENVIDSYVIAELELREKKIPFIIKRPIPGGAFEYWYIKDLENINF